MKLHLKSDVIDGSVVNGIREPIFFSFILDRPSGYKVFHQPETVLYKKKKQKYFEYYNIIFRKW